MSRENVELVREALGDGRFDLVEAFAGEPPPDLDLTLLADDAEVVFMGPSPGVEDLTYTGVAGLADGWRDWLEPWSSYVMELERIVDAGDSVVTLATLRGETKRDRVTMEQPAAAVWKFRGGKAVRVEFHLDRRAALESVGRADLLS